MNKNYLKVNNIKTKKTKTKIIIVPQEKLIFYLKTLTTVHKTALKFFE